MSQLSESNSIAPSFGHLLRAALNAINAGGRVSGEHAQALQRLVREERRSGYRGLESAPHEYLGAFESLSGSAQQTLIDSIVQRDRYRMSGYRAGAWHLAMTRLLLALRNSALRTTAVPNVVKQLLDVLAFGFRAAPAAMLEAFHHHRLVLMGRLNHRPSVLALLEAARIDARSFAVCYAQGIPQPPAYRGLWHDEERHNTIAMVVGIDLVPLSNGWLVVETNPSAAQKFHGLLPYDSYNPFIAHLLEFAVENRYQRLVIMNNDSEGMDPQLARQYLESAQKCGIALKIYERASVPSTCTAFERCAEVPDFEVKARWSFSFEAIKPPWISCLTINARACVLLPRIGIALRTMLFVYPLLRVNRSWGTATAMSRFLRWYTNYVNSTTAAACFS